MRFRTDWKPEFSFSHRVLGSLLSAHIIITDSKQPFGDMTIKDYDNELLHLAHDLAVRLLPAFENTKTGIPYPRVSAHSSPGGNSLKAAFQNPTTEILCPFMCPWGVKPALSYTGGHCSKFWWYKLLLLSSKCFPWFFTLGQELFVSVLFAWSIPCPVSHSSKQYCH